jgi:hypothetical protein
MRSHLGFRSALLCLAVLAAAACGDSNGTTGPEPEPTPNFVHLQSDAGDFIGAGGTYEYTQANSLLTVEAQGGHLTLSIRGDRSWNADFQLPAGMSQIRAGSYTGLTRWPFHNPAKGGIDWNGEGRGCNTITGSFIVDSVRYQGGALARLDLRFEQHCEGHAPALRGTLHWRDDDETAPPPPVNPVPAGLWQPPASVLPSSGNYAYLESQPGDFIGAGQTHLHTPGDSQISVGGFGGLASVRVDDWVGSFQAMSTLTRVQPGYYGDLADPTRNPAKGGLSWWGNGRACNRVTGWFAVDHVAYSGSTMTALDLRFEQHCEGFAPALHGAIHWRG